MVDRLEEYEKRRDFRSTPEPAGGEPGKRASGDPIFVIQKHDASSLHYDVRIEVGGVLVSWAVPKGPSTDPREKRLAVPTEDHPMGYADFEGVIPSGYGAGTVIVWDRGTYRNLEPDTSVDDQLEAGHVKIWLEGQKLRGGWAFQRIAKGKDARWLMVKIRDEGADARRRPTSTQPESVITGRTLDDLEPAP